MSKKDENNSHIMIKNNSIQNLNKQNKNKFPNFLTDSPSTQITAHIHSLNSNPNSKNKNRKNDKNTNEIVKYINNDKYNLKGNFLNMTQNYSKYILTTPNVKKNKNSIFSYTYDDDYNNIYTQKKKNNNTINKSDKKIYFMKPIEKRKKSYGNKNNKNKNISNKDSLDDIINNSVLNPEELHFFYVKILQKGKKISTKFEID